MTTLREAAQNVVDVWKLYGTADSLRGWMEILEAALAEPCPCGDRPADQCSGEWEPDCNLGNNPKYAKRVELTPKELAASIKRGEKWKVAEPMQEPHLFPLQSDRMRIDQVTGDVGIGTPIAEPVQEPAQDHFPDVTKMVQEPVANNPDPYHLSRILHELAGSASMCWEHVDRAGIFQSTQAAEFVAAAIDEIRQRMELAPPQRKPLTEEEIYKMYNEPRSDAEMVDFARAIERAHGIGEQP